MAIVKCSVKIIDNYAFWLHYYTELMFFDDDPKIVTYNNEKNKTLL